MQLKYWCFLPCRDWESFHFVPILDQSQMETARHFMTILCLYCIAELHIHIQFSTIVAFPVTVPIYSLFFHVSFKFPSIHLLFSSAATWLAQDKGNLQPSLRWDPVPSPPWPWSSFRSFQYQPSSATYILLIFHNCPRSSTQLSQLSTDPSSKAALESDLYPMHDTSLPWPQSWPLSHTSLTMRPDVSSSMQWKHRHRIIWAWSVS